MAIGSLPLIPKYFVSVLIERDKNVTNEKAPARRQPGLSQFTIIESAVVRAPRHAAYSGGGVKQKTRPG
jgi:hypothetical protein